MAIDSFVRIPPDSTGKRLATYQHTIDGLPVDVQKQHIVGIDPANIQDVDSAGNSYTRFLDGHPIFDPFNNFKVSEMNILGVYDYQNDGYFDIVTDEVSAGGNIEYEVNSASMLFETTNDNGSFAKRTTDRYHYHQPGTSMHIIMNIQNSDNGKVGNIRRWGYYDDYDGAYFQLTEEGGHDVGFRSSVSGVPINYLIPWAQFNGDPVDGTGKSGFTVDITKWTQFWITVGGRGGTKVAFGLYYQGQRITVHTLDPLTTSTFRTTSLPVRIENFNTEMTSGGSELRSNSCIVKSTGNTNYTFWRFADLECTLKPVTTNTPLIFGRPKELLPNGKINNINVYPETLSVYCSAGPVKIQVVQAVVDDLTDDTWDITGVSTLMGDTTSTAISAGSATYWVMTTYYCDIGVTNIDISKQFELNDEGWLTNADGTNLEILGLVATSLIGGTVLVSATLSYRELW